MYFGAGQRCGDLVRWARSGWSSAYFLKTSPFDETALNYLASGDVEKAKEIWGKVTNGREISSKNFSSFNNIGTLNLMSSSTTDIQQGIESKLKLIQSSHFNDYIHSVADVTFTIDRKKQEAFFIDQLIQQLENESKYSPDEIVSLFVNCGQETQKHINLKFTEDHMHAIEKNIATTKKKRKEHPREAYEYGRLLINQAQAHLDKLIYFLGSNNMQVKMHSDNLAKEIMQCGIDYFKEMKDSEDPSKKGLQLLKHAKK